MFSTAVLYVALTTFHEARGEPKICQLYVAESVRNRMDQWDMSAKEVVRQPHQYSWTTLIKGKSIKQEYKRIQTKANPKDKKALEDAIAIATWVLSPVYVSVSDTMYFHDNSIRTPRHFKRKVKCGAMVFSN